MPQIAPEIYRSMGLRDSEFEEICHRLGRHPTHSELGMFAVMWSEHCGYKYSRKVLAKFKNYKEATEGSGLENAGVIAIGDGLGITFKVESHNHPSAVEPYQGAATGVGGILRDIFTMGARPIGSLNSLRFGPISGNEVPVETKARNRFLFTRVVAGIAGYGNCVGVPTVGGEVSFHPSYSGNPLVNAMSIGLVEVAKVTTSAASGVGNPVIYLGSATGLDGIHGATFASVDLDEESDSKRPNVQIGDPFAEKSLIEATLEALATGAIVAIQDMGAAGITCSTVEMASKGEEGMDINLDRVPMRDSSMGAYELLLSESQERMLCVAEKGREGEVLEVFKKWGLPAAVVGTVTDKPILRISRHGKTEVELNPKLLTDFCPSYCTDSVEDPVVIEARSWRESEIPGIKIIDALPRLLSSPEIGSRKWIYNQFDSQVQTQTFVGPGGGDAAVFAPRGTCKGVSVALDGNGRQVWLDPFGGAINTVAEAARNVACTGAKPVGCTDGLNFGNPENPHVYYQFSEAVEGLAFACESLETPVVSGNVSFYNRSESGEIIPTPVIGMVGILDDARNALPSAPANGEGKHLGLLIASPDSLNSPLGGSQFVATFLGKDLGQPTRADLVKEKRLHGLLVRLAAERLVESAHDSSEGGLGVAISEIAIKAQLGLRTKLDFAKFAELSDQELLFGEIPGLVLISYRQESLEEIKDVASEASIGFESLGSFFGTELELSVGDQTWKWSVSELKRGYDSALN